MYLSKSPIDGFCSTESTYIHNQIDQGQEEFSQKVRLFLSYHKSMNTSHLEVVWPVNG